MNALDIIRKRFQGPALLLLALFAHPLVYRKLFVSRVPYWGEVELLGTGAIALICLGMVLPRIRGSFSWKRLPAIDRVWWIVIGALLVTAISRPFVCGVPFQSLPSDLFHVAVPVAGWLYAREIRRTFALSMTLLLGILILFTIRSDCFQGLPGNWNWNLTMLAITIPAPFVLSAPLKKRIQLLLVLGFAISVIILIGISLVRPDIAPKGTIFAVCAGGLLAICARRWRRRGICAAVVLAAMLLALPFAFDHFAFKSTDIRIQFVRSARNLVIEHSPIGTGTIRYEPELQWHLTPEFHYCRYHTARNPHPHNEFWYLFGACGVAGAVFLIMSFLLAWRNSGRSATSDYMLWCFLVLLLHGQMDVLLSQPLPGTIFLLLCGTIPSRARSGNRSLPMSLAGAVVFLTGVLFATQTFWSGLLYREALLAKSVTERQRFAAASIDVMETARARYVNGVSLLDLLRFQESAFEFERMHDHIVPRGYVHSFAYEARARASLGDFKKAMELLDKERHRYPHSVTCQYFILKAAVDSQADILVIDTESRRLDELMQERHLNRSMISEIVLSPELDDEGMIFRF